MFTEYNSFFILIICYFIGSIPFGLLISKITKKNDPRLFGSKNIGATNVLRTGNKFIAGLTLFLDISKGAIAVMVSHYYFPNLIYLSGLMAFLGHIFPVWLKFKGGKGIATYLGILFVISFKLGLIFCLTWIIVALITKYSSLSSIVSALVIFLISVYQNNLELNFFLFIVFVVILYTHRQNIIRLKNKKEDKIKL